MGYGQKNEEPPEIISDPARIISVLNKIYRQRSLLSISFPASGYGKDRGDSLIVEVNKRKQHLLLNKLQPEHAHALLIKEKKIQIKSFFSGIQVTFDSELKQLIDEDGDIYYLLDIPKKIRYHQKRTAHRANTSSDNPVPVIIQLDDDTKLDGIVEDISIGGLSITFTTNLPHVLQIGKTMTSCRFNIPNEGVIVCQLNIRFIQHDYEDSPPKIGARFEELEQSDHRLITQFVMALDRERRRTSIK